MEELRTLSTTQYSQQSCIWKSPLNTSTNVQTKKWTDFSSQGSLSYSVMVLLDLLGQVSTSRSPRPKFPLYMEIFPMWKMNLNLQEQGQQHSLFPRTRRILDSSGLSYSLTVAWQNREIWSLAVGRWEEHCLGRETARLPYRSTLPNMLQSPCLACWLVLLQQMWEQELKPGATWSAPRITKTRMRSLMPGEEDMGRDGRISLLVDRHPQKK